MPDGDIEAFSDLDRDTVDRIVSGADHESLTEAMAADAIDVVPIVGDLLAYKRKQAAEEQDGIEYPDKPAYIENAVSDLPPPIDTAADVVISQNTIRYVNENSKASPFMQIDEKTGELIARLPPKPGEQ